MRVGGIQYIVIYAILLPMNDIKITDATAEDVEGIQTVFDETWLATYPNEEFGITREDILDKRQGSFDPERLQKRRDHFESPPKNQKFVVAKDGEKIIGVCSLHREENYNKLSTIYILPEYQGRGIGKQLWEAVVPFLDVEKDTIVKVATYNKKAIAFYERLGFVDTGNRFRDEKFRMKSGALIPEMELVIKSNL
jgi:ribosomal protein S18 acetylase RimI-like enzyme